MDIRSRYESALAERDGKVWRARGEPPVTCLGTLPQLSENGNNGWEGLAHAAYEAGRG